jgi:hypothetical protein
VTSCLLCSVQCKKCFERQAGRKGEERRQCALHTTEKAFKGRQAGRRRYADALLHCNSADNSIRHHSCLISMLSYTGMQAAMHCCMRHMHTTHLLAHLDHKRVALSLLCLTRSTHPAQPSLQETCKCMPHKNTSHQSILIPCRFDNGTSRGSVCQHALHTASIPTIKMHLDAPAAQTSLAHRI